MPRYHASSLRYLKLWPNLRSINKMYNNLHELSNISISYNINFEMQRQATLAQRQSRGSSNRGLTYIDTMKNSAPNYGSSIKKPSSYNYVDANAKSAIRANNASAFKGSLKQDSTQSYNYNYYHQQSSKTGMKDTKYGLIGNANDFEYKLTDSKNQPQQFRIRPNIKENMANSRKTQKDDEEKQLQQREKQLIQAAKRANASGVPKYQQNKTNTYIRGPSQTDTRDRLAKERQAREEIQRQKQRQRQREKQREQREKEQERFQKQKERIKAMQIQRERQRERQRILLKQKQRKQKQIQKEKEREKEKQRQRQRERQREKQRLLKQRERQKQRQKQPQQKLRRQREVQRERERQKEREGEREREKQRSLKQRQRERQRQKQREKQKQKQRQQKMRKQSSQIESFYKKSQPYSKPVSSMNNSSTTAGTNDYSSSSLRNAGNYAFSTSSSKTIGLVGLNNIGNTCFMNSILQCVFNLPGFNDYFLSGKYQSEIKSSARVAQAYASTIKTMRTSTSRSQTPSELKSAIGAKKSRFMGYAQQDAQQFLAALLELLSIDLNRSKNPKYKELTADLSKQSLKQISDDWWNYNKQREDSIVCDYFSGQVLSRVVCTKCKNQSIAFDNIWDMALNFSPNDKGDIIKMIDNFLKQETISDDYYCTKCKTLRPCQRKIDFYRLPKILVFQLKRFSYGRFKKVKLNNRVKVQTVLDLSSLITESNHESVKNPVYNLVGVVNHSGDIDFGHYTAQCRNPINGKWYDFNDSSVHEIKINDQFDSSSPYLLFYAKQSM